MVRRQSSPAQLLEANGSEVGRGLLGWELGLLCAWADREGGGWLRAQERGGEVVGRRMDRSGWIREGGRLDGENKEGGGGCCWIGSGKNPIKEGGWSVGGGDRIDGTASSILGLATYIAGG